VFAPITINPPLLFYRKIVDKEKRFKYNMELESNTEYQKTLF